MTTKKQEALSQAAKRLETGESFKNLSRSAPATSRRMHADAEEERRKLLEELKKVGGVSDGD